MAKYFYEKRVTDTLKVLSVGNIVVDIPFTPDYIKVKFLDVDTYPEKDTIIWDLVWVAKDSYQLTISYNTHQTPRRLRFLVAKLSEVKGSVQ